MSNLLTRPLKKLQTYDQRRPGLPGDHWLVLAAGVAVLLATRRSASPIRRAIGIAVGGAMLARAASGRDGLSKALQ